MDWHLIEVGVVTTLSIWVYLFSSSTVSRIAAAVMFVLNLLWIFVERERARTGQPGPAKGPVGVDEAGPEPAPQAEAGAQTGGNTPPRNPRVI